MGNDAERKTLLTQGVVKKSGAELEMAQQQADRLQIGPTDSPRPEIIEPLKKE